MPASNRKSTCHSRQSVCLVPLFFPFFSYHSGCDVVSTGALVPSLLPLTAARKIAAAPSASVAFQVEACDTTCEGFCVGLCQRVTATLLFACRSPAAQLSRVSERLSLTARRRLTVVASSSPSSLLSFTSNSMPFSFLSHCFFNRHNRSFLLSPLRSPGHPFFAVAFHT